MTLLYGFAAVVPGATRKVLDAFPRHKPTAWALTIVDLVWAGKLLYNAPLGRFENLKPLLYILTPVAIVLVGLFVDELLSPRALGGLLLLLAAPMLDTARWHASPLRLVITVLAYALVIKGVVLVVCPFQFRKWVQRLFPDERWCRIWGGAGCALGIVVLLLSLTIY